MADFENLRLCDLWNSEDGPTPYEKDGVMIWLSWDKKQKPSIRASVDGNGSSFSYSKYGLKQAKEWLLERM